MLRSDPPAIVVDGVHKSFGAITALAGVDLEAPAGRVFGLLGPNGAGKTTLVRLLPTLLKPDRGTVRVLGLDVARQAEALRPRIGLAGQYAAVDENLTGRENLRMVGLLYHLPRREARRRADQALARLDLTGAADRPVKTYSGGMRRRLDLGASLVGQPEVLFLDEPTTGLDPRTRLELWDIIEELVAGGTTLLLTTQYLEEADRLADRIAVIDHGRVIAEGTSSELKARVGTDVVYVRVRTADDLERARVALDGLATGPTKVDPAELELHVPIADGPRGLMAAVRALDGTDVEVADLGLQRASLDDVFLTLTGQPVDDDAVGPDAHPHAGRAS